MKMDKIWSKKSKLGDAQRDLFQGNTAQRLRTSCAVKFFVKGIKKLAVPTLAGTAKSIYRAAAGEKAALRPGRPRLPTRPVENKSDALPLPPQDLTKKADRNFYRPLWGQDRSAARLERLRMGALLRGGGGLHAHFAASDVRAAAFHAAHGLGRLAALLLALQVLLVQNALLLLGLFL